MRSVSARVPSFRVGEVRTLRAVIDAELVRRFAALSGDENPIHLEAAEARAYGYPRQVAHGAILVGLISRAIGMEIPGPGAVWTSQSIDWLEPVFVGDEVELTVEVAAYSEGARLLALSTTAKNQRGTTVMNGKATVKISQKLAPARDSEAVAGVALVTGGSRGIGAAVARELAACGLAVAIAYHESESDASALAAEIEAAGGRAAAFGADLTDPANASRLAAEVAARWGRVDVVVHGASPRVRAAKATELRWEDVEPFLKTYVGSGLALARAAAPAMIEAGHGRLIFLGTSFLFGAPPAGVAPYVVAKEALWGLVKSLAVELGPSGITVNLVSPGMTVTDFTADIPVRLKELEARRSPMRRLATVGDTARAVAFLASADAGYVNGTNLSVTGGPV